MKKDMQRPVIRLRQRSTGRHGVSYIALHGVIWDALPLNSTSRLITIRNSIQLREQGEANIGSIGILSV